MKRLIVCADGTWNEPTQDCPTNVVKIARLIEQADPRGQAQIVYYHEGVGTGKGPVDRITGGAIGEGIDQNIEDIYRFLALNYQPPSKNGNAEDPGDELWLFGFSRGAYTVRSVVGLIYNCGLLQREHFELYGRAYELYRDRSDTSRPGSDDARKFREQYTHEPTIHFVGVWDTVGALGIPIHGLRFWSKDEYKFHDVKLNRRVKVAYQALAIDERRKPFEASVWERSDGVDPSQQVLEQAWFPGVHCDVGGGYSESQLSDGALIWMIQAAERAGLQFHGLDSLKASSTGQIHDSMNLGYRLLGDGTRRIGGKNPGGNERLSATTEERRSKTDYNPQNLADFLNKQRT